MFWHYTVGTALLQIIADGRIRRAEKGVSRNERRAVWFSSRETFEPTAIKVLMNRSGDMRKATLDEMIQGCGALVRIAVHPGLPGTPGRNTGASARSIPAMLTLWRG